MVVLAKTNEKEVAELIDFFYQMRDHGLFKSRKIKDIVSELGMPEKKASFNLRRILDRKIGRMAVSFNHKKIGIFTSLLLVKTSNPSCNRAFFDRALKIPFVENVTQVIGGEATHIITIKVPTINLLEGTVDKIRGEFLESGEEEERGLIEWTNTKLVYDYALDQTFSYITVPEKEWKIENIDFKDWGILEILRADALTPLKEMGRKLNLAPPAILRRIRLLENRGIINGYYCKGHWGEVPFELQPLTTYLLIRYRGTTPSIKPFVKSILDLKKIYASDIYYLHGEDDLSVTFRIRSVSEFQKFLNSEFINSENIAQIKTYSVTRIANRPVLRDFVKLAQERETKRA